VREEQAGLRWGNWSVVVMEVFQRASELMTATTSR